MPRKRGARMLAEYRGGERKAPEPPDLSREEKARQSVRRRTNSTRWVAP